MSAPAAPVGYDVAASGRRRLHLRQSAFLRIGRKFEAQQAGCRIGRNGHAGGYWIAAGDGGVFTFGDARFWVAGRSALNAPVVGIAASHDGRGYWLVAADGGVFNYGDAGFHGSAGFAARTRPSSHVPDGQRPGLLARCLDGGVFNYGDAGFYGSRGA